MVGVVDDEVDSRKAYHFVQLVAAFVDASVFRHEGAHFEAFFLHFVRQHLACGAQGCGLEVGGDFLRDVKDFLVSHQIGHNSDRLRRVTSAVRRKC